MLPPKTRAGIRCRHTARLLELLLQGRSQHQIAADLGMSAGYVNALHAEAVAAALSRDKEALRQRALAQAHMHDLLFDRMRQIAFDRSLRVRTVEQNGDTERIIEVKDFEALRKMGDGMVKQSARFGKICGTDAPTKVEVEAPPGLSPEELAEIVRESRKTKPCANRE